MNGLKVQETDNPFIRYLRNLNHIILVDDKI